MKHLLFILSICLSAVVTYAQQTLKIELPITTSAKVANTKLGKNTNATITSVTCDISSQKGYDYILGILSADGKKYTVDLKKTPNLAFSTNISDKDTYWYARTIQKTLPNLSKMSNAYGLRTQAESIANQTITAMRNESRFIEDAYLTSYLYSMLVKINPSQRLDFFKYNFRVYIKKDDTPNAGIYPTGALVINAGMLARIHTEDELIAILCHEANHFICNHYLDNMAKIQRQAIAAAVTGGILGATTGALTGSASLGLSTASTISSISASITAMGLAFDQTQEKESDQAAVDLLPVLGYDRNAMATCIKAIGNYYLEEGNLAAYYKKSGDHPSIEERIAATGIPYERRDSAFEKKIASCVSYVGWEMWKKGRYSQALELCEQNISSGAGHGIDYYIKGECLLATFDSYETNFAARESLLKAREIYPNDILVIKALVAANIRLGNKEEARSLLGECIKLSKDEENRIWATNMLKNI